MSYLEELLPEFRKGAKIRRKDWANKDYYIKLSGVYTRYKNDDAYYINPNELVAKDWELYQEPIDWDYIIKNKCLCYFSNNDYSANYFGYLKVREEDDNFFIDNKLNKWNNCRPVRRDEVNFYEERKDD